MPSNTRVIVLAAGKGTRMNRDVPKVLVPFEGKPLIQRLLDAVAESCVDPRPVIVTGFRADLVEQALGPGYDYVRQEEQLGTGHAVACAEPLLAGAADYIIVLYGDHPFVRPETIAALQALHERTECVLSLATATVDDFVGWRSPFADFSRIIRDASGRIVADVQVKDATPAQLDIREVNTAVFCFTAAWLWPHLKKIDNRNAAGEYYLTDLVRIAIDEDECIASLPIDPAEAIGINAPEHLNAAASLGR